MSRFFHHDSGRAHDYGLCNCPSCTSVPSGERVALIAGGCLLASAILWLAGLDLYGAALLRWLGW